MYFTNLLAATPLVVASVGVASGIVGGIGASSAFHGTASLIKGASRMHSHCTYQ
jgi:hypothetical protein